MYLIKDVREAYEQERKTTDNKLKHICDGFRETATTVFFLLCKQCTMQFSELFGITQTLTDFYYSEQLTTRLLEVGFALVEAGLRQRDIVPYLYFLDFTKN